jgi:universal stress protein E
MKTIHRTLVVIDPHQSEAQILERAKSIADLTQSHLHLLTCNKKSDLSSHLLDMQDALIEQGFSVSAQQAWNGNPHKTIIAVQQEQGCSLVIKQHQPDNPLTKSFLSPDDWALLRYCPCPILIVKAAVSWTGGVILAAVDVGSSDIEHRILQTGIVSHGFDLTQLTGGSLHLVSACPSPTQSAADPMYQLRESIQSYYREQCQAFQDEFNIDEQHTHIEEGPAELLIPQLAHRLKAAITVIGSVARTGLAGALYGNTSEMILDSVESDVLVLKANDVITHLEELTAPPLRIASINTQAHTWPYNHPVRISN